jgi:hypothetical protein
MSDKITYGEWQIWNGGECPVDPETKVQVHLIHETRGQAIKRPHEEAKEWVWRFDGDGSIIAYRVVKEPVREVMEFPASAKAFSCTAPMIWDEEDTPNDPAFQRGTVKVEIVDGQIVEILWKPAQ